jgi:hypothetical protein
MRVVFILLTLVLILTPFIADAQFTGQLVPCTGVDPVTGVSTCNACQLVSLAQNIINFFVYLAVVFATLLFAYAGIQYATSAANPEQIAKAHRIFWNVLIGMVFVLAAWLIVDVVMKTFYKSELGPWNNILCGGQESATDALFSDQIFGPGQVPTETTGGITTTPGSSGEYVIPQGTLSSATINQSLGRIEDYDAELFAQTQQYSNVTENEIRALAVVESKGDPLARNGESVGLLQVDIDTARELNPALQGLSDNAVTQWLHDPANNYQVGVKYYAQLKEQFSDPDLASAAFNGGPGANLPSADCDGLRRWQCPYDSRLSNGMSCWNTGQTGCELNTGYVETRKYVADVKQVREALQP